MNPGRDGAEPSFANGATDITWMVGRKLAANRPLGSWFERFSPKGSEAKWSKRSQFRRPKDMKSSNRSHDYAECIDCMAHRELRPLDLRSELANARLPPFSSPLSIASSSRGQTRSRVEVWPVVSFYIQSSPVPRRRA